MPASANRRLHPHEVPPGPAGVRSLHAVLAAALDGTGPALALLPSESGTEHAHRQLAALHLDQPLESNAVAVVVTTSGSTGNPLGVLLPGEALQAAARATHAFLDRAPGRWVVAMPVTAVGGLMTVVRAVDAGIEPVAWDGIGGAASFTVESFAVCAEHALSASRADGAPTYVSLVPTQLSRMCASNAGLDLLARFDHVLIGAAALPSGLRHRAESAGVRLSSTYGASETCGGVVYDGIPLPGVTVSIDSGDREGLVNLGGTTIALGYRGLPELTESTFAAGWYRTADVGRIDDGVLTVLGRGDDVIKVGGVKVALLAIADAASALPGIEDAAVVAVDDPEWGQRPLLFVVGSAPDHEVLAAIDASVGRTRVTLRRVDALPYLPNGKIDRMTLRAQLNDPTPNTDGR